MVLRRLKMAAHLHIAKATGCRQHRRQAMVHILCTYIWNLVHIQKGADHLFSNLSHVKCTVGPEACKSSYGFIHSASLSTRHLTKQDTKLNMHKQKSTTSPHSLVSIWQITKEFNRTFIGCCKFRLAYQLSCCKFSTTYQFSIELSTTLTPPRKLWIKHSPHL